MHRIMIIHPEGNFNNNPNLSGMVEILCENDYEVHIYSPQIGCLDQSAPCVGSKIFLNESKKFLSLVTAVLPTDVLRTSGSVGNYINLNIPRFDLVIGVDRGIIEASIVAKHYGVPYGFISYEILFAEETGAEYLKADIEASRGIAFAVCQDRLRSSHLSKEYGIPLDKIIDIPVAGRSAKRGARTSMLHNKLGLPEQTKIALYIGSVMSPFAGIDELIKGSDNWPDNWVLVLHERYSRYSRKIVNRINSKEKKNIFFSQFFALPFKRIYELLHSADIGMSLYVPQFQSNSVYLRNNIKYLGMASGKSAVYLQHNLPILINEVGELSEHTRRDNLGRVVGDLRDIPTVLSSLSREDLSLCRENSISFFERVLDLDLRIQPLLSTVHTLIRDEQIVELVTNIAENVAPTESLRIAGDEGCQVQAPFEGKFKGLHDGMGDKLCGWARNQKPPRLNVLNVPGSIGKGERVIVSEGRGGVESPEKLYQKAQVLINSDRVEEGIRALEILLESYPDYAIAHNDLGTLYFNKGRKDKILEHYRVAVDLDPCNPLFQKNLADFYYVILGQVEDAIEHYVMALSSKPGDIETLLMLGHISVSLKRFDVANDFYNEVLKNDPENNDARKMLDEISKSPRPESMGFVD